MKLILIILIALISITVTFSSLNYHCEIPCGIYNDEMRIAMLQEHIDTIEKSMNMISLLSEQKDKNYNQIVRWINNKEDHANHIQNITYQYFMTQRVKPIEKEDELKYKDYVEKLTLLHEMLIYAMKSKQSIDLDNVKKLRDILKNFNSLYFKK